MKIMKLLDHTINKCRCTKNQLEGGFIKKKKKKKVSYFALFNKILIIMFIKYET
jgi:hypothetical protein